MPLSASLRIPFIHVRQAFFEGHHIRMKLLHRDLGIDLGRSDVRVAKDTTDALNGHPFVDGQDGKAMSGTVHRDMFMEPHLVHHLSDMIGHGTVFQTSENPIVAFFLIVQDDMMWNLQQFDLIGNSGLMPS